MFLRVHTDSITKNSDIYIKTHMKQAQYNTNKPNEVSTNLCV